MSDSTDNKSQPPSKAATSSSKSAKAAAQAQTTSPDSQSQSGPDAAQPGSTSAQPGSASTQAESSSAQPDPEAATDPSATMATAPVMLPELGFLFRLIRYRLARYFQGNETDNTPPVLPPPDRWGTLVGKFVNDNALNPEEATLLLIAIAPHIQPDIYDSAIDTMLKGSGDFPRIGGVRGKNFRGFLPTGETALFLLGGDSFNKRKQIQQLFWADHFFGKKKILWLEDNAPGEPLMSGKIILSQDYIDLLTHGKPVAPHFSMSFPARLVTTQLNWDDLIINPTLRGQITDILSWIKYNASLREKWGIGGAMKKGYRALFYGPPGTGKTFTACLLGKYTGKDVYRIDLSMVVSKYIGETEKNLELLFARAEDKEWILFFDEADALFGKRTNVRDAHDKYANQEVSYLLQRIEDYDGLVILATNMKNNIDDAFMRRFDAVLKFSMPVEEERKRIWEKTFPDGVLFSEKLPSTNTSSLAQQPSGNAFSIPEAVKKYELSGGNIVNIVHYTSIIGAKRMEEAALTKPQAAQTEPLTIYLPDVIEGIKRELNKDGIPF